jgi:hypothetical protein
MAELTGSSLNLTTQSGTTEDSGYMIANDDAISTEKQPYKGSVYEYSSVDSVSEDSLVTISHSGILTDNNVKRIQYPLVSMDYGVVFADAEPLIGSKSNRTIVGGYLLNGASMFSFMNKDKSDSVISLITMGTRKKPYDNAMNRYIKGRMKFN